MNMQMLSINERIKRFRRINNYTQTQMGEFLGIKTSTYSQKERKGIISAEDIIKFSEIFNISPYILLYGEEPRNEQSPLYNNETYTETVQNIKTEYHRQYSFIECAGKKELEMFKLITFLNKKDRDKVHQFAYELYKNRRKRC